MTNKIHSKCLIDEIGDVFLQSYEDFIVYTPYCRLHATGLSKLQSLINSNKRLRTFLEELYRAQATRGLDLASFLLKPIQRI
ncbi:Dbl homology domain-containing protein [Paraphysoderma sedebokerense]|nr:Dbl homology domain-containing protein [Paraphysoderma sedebokerense]